MASREKVRKLAKHQKKDTREKVKNNAKISPLQVPIRLTRMPPSNFQALVVGLPSKLASLGLASSELELELSVMLGFLAMS